MSGVSTYLNFSHQTEEAFNFYKTVFGTEFSGDGFMRFKDVPPAEGMPLMIAPDNNLIMHVALPIVGGHKLMGSDVPESMGFMVKMGNNFYINLEVDTREETRRLFDALAVGGKVEQDLQDMFWGDYYGSLQDKYRVKWMFNCSEKA
jgi:PhnB protein